MDKQTPKMWEQLPNETDKAFLAFSTFLQMPIKDTDKKKERTLYNLSVRLGYAVSGTKPASTIESWSSKYNWRDRVRAYDMYMQNTAMTVIESELVDYQRNVIETRTMQLHVLNQVIERTLNDLLNSNKEVDPLDVQRVAASMKTADDLSRRIAKMPTTFRTEEAVEIDDDLQTYLIGG